MVGGDGDVDVEVVVVDDFVVFDFGVDVWELV